MARGHSAPALDGALGPRCALLNDWSWLTLSLAAPQLLGHDHTGPRHLVRDGNGGKGARTRSPNRPATPAACANRRKVPTFSGLADHGPGRLSFGGFAVIQIKPEGGPVAAPHGRL